MGESGIGFFEMVANLDARASGARQCAKNFNVAIKITKTLLL